MAFDLKSGSAYSYTPPTTGSSAPAPAPTSSINPAISSPASPVPAGADVLGTMGGQQFFVGGQPQSTAPVTMTPNQAFNNTAVPVPGSDGTPKTTADGLVNGVQTNLQNIIANLTPPPTAEETQQKGILDSLSSLTSADTGKTQYRAEQEIAAGVPDIQKQQNEINGQILTQMAEYNKMTTDAEAAKAALPTGGIAAGTYFGQQAQIDRQTASLRASKAAEIGMLNARASFLQGSYDTAERNVDRAMDAKYAPIEDQIKVKKAQLEALAPILDKQQKVTALAQQKALEDEAQRIADEKAKAKDNLSTSLAAGISTKFVNRNGEFFSNTDGKSFATPEEFFKAAGVKSFAEAYQKGIVSDLTNATVQNVEFAKQAMVKYPDAKITPNMTPDQVAQAIRGSRIYQREVYIAPSGGSGSGSGLAGTNIIDSATDAGVKSLISQNMKGGYGNAYEAVKAKYGEQVANAYDKVYQDVFNKGASVDAAFNNLKVSGGPNLKMTPAQISTALNQVAGSFDNEPIVKQFNTINEGYQFVKSLNNNTRNPSDDQALIYAFAKAMDPGSVVREGEYATVQKYSQSWIKSYGKGIEQAINGTGFLSPVARKNIKDTIENRYNISKQNYDNVYNQYQQRRSDILAGKGNTITDYSQAFENNNTFGEQIIEYQGKQYKVDSQGNMTPL